MLSFSAVQSGLADLVTNKVNSKYGTDIRIGKVDLSSIRKLKIRNILIRDHRQDSMIFASRLETSILNYSNLFKSNLDLGDVALYDGFFHLTKHKGDSLQNIAVFAEKFKKEEKTSQNEFKMMSSSIEVNNVDFVLIDENKKDEALVSYLGIHGNFDNFRIIGSSVSADIRSASMLENHGLEIIDFNTRFHYSDTSMTFEDTRLATNKSNIRANIRFNYKEGDLSDFSDRVAIDANFDDSEIVLADLKKFYGEFGKYDKIYFNGRAQGTLNEFTLSDIRLSSNRNSSLRGTIYFRNILDKEKFYLRGDLDELSSNYDHLVHLLPNILGKKVPPALERVGYFSSAGHVEVSRSSLLAQLKTIAELGLSDVDLRLDDIDKGDMASYKGKVELIDFKLGRFVGDSLLGQLSMVGEVEGRGFSLENMAINVKGHISKHEYKGYTYSNIDINGELRDKQFNGNLRVDDPNLQLEFSGLAVLDRSYYNLNFDANVMHADILKLNLFTRDSKAILKGMIDIDLEGSNIEDLEGRISFRDASYSNQNDDYYFKDFNISSTNQEDAREVTINSSEIITGYMRGNFKFGELKKLGMNSLGSLFVNYEKLKVEEGQFLDFRFNIYNKIVEVFYPDLVLGPNTVLYGEINSDEDVFKLQVRSPSVEAFDFYIDRINLQVDNQNPLFSTLLSVDALETKYYDLSDINLVNVMLNDTLFMQADMIGGKKMKERYKFSFYHTFNEENQSVVGMKRSELFFKDNVWFINPDDNNQNKVVYDGDLDTYAIDNFNMVSGEQRIDLSGLLQGKNEHNIDLEMTNVNLIDITPDIDSVVVDGKVNGSVQLRPVNGKVLPLVDLIVNYFSINDDYYGDFEIDASSDDNIRNYTFALRLLNSGLNTFNATGAIDFTSQSPTILATVNMDRFRINSFSSLGKNVLSNLRGFASGEAVVSGGLSSPDINGEIILDNAGMALPYLNVDYDFRGNTVVSLYDHTFDFKNVDLVDKAMGTTGTLQGTITHEGFKKWVLDLRLRTDNLLVLNTTDQEGALYYGTGLLSGSTRLWGPTDNLVIDVRGRTNRGTEFIVPLGNVSTVNKTKLIHFENVQEDVEEGGKREVVFERFKGLSLNFDLEVTRDAVAEIVLDRATGSVLRGSGDGDLTLNIDTNGKFEMYGNILVNNGEYQFKNIVNKDFIVQQGGTIIWDGNPYDAEVNITAINYTKANPAVLLDEIASSRKIDVELHTKITGKLSAPDFNFDVKIPNASSVVSNELDFKLRNEDDKLNQFFSLLATGSFASVADNKTNFNSNAAIAGTIAQKASQLLSNMLESENDNFQVGVTYDIGTENSVQDVTTDDQLGVEVSGRIGEKVMVSGMVGVPVGSNTNSKVIGEVEVKVPLNESETLQGKVYNRQNEIQFDVVEGEGYTQGVGISYRFDFNNGKEFLEKLGLKKTEEEKQMTEEQLDSVKLEKKVEKRFAKQEKKETKSDD